MFHLIKSREYICILFSWTELCVDYYLVQFISTTLDTTFDVIFFVFFFWQQPYPLATNRESMRRVHHCSASTSFDSTVCYASIACDSSLNWDEQSDGHIAAQDISDCRVDSADPNADEKRAAPVVFRRGDMAEDNCFHYCYLHAINYWYYCYCYRHYQ